MNWTEQERETVVILPRQRAGIVAQSRRGLNWGHSLKPACSGCRCLPCTSPAPGTHPFRIIETGKSDHARGRIMKYTGSRAREVGRNLPLSLPRRVMCDLLAFAKAIPSVPVQRQMNVAAVAAARAALASTPDTPGWCALFAKAYGITAARFLGAPRVPHPAPPAPLRAPLQRRLHRLRARVPGRRRSSGATCGTPSGSPAQLQARLRHFETPYREHPRVPPPPARGPPPAAAAAAAVVGRAELLRRKRAGYFRTFGISVYSGLGRIAAPHLAADRHHELRPHRATAASACASSTTTGSWTARTSPDSSAA
jgi:hypothetical protein